MNPIEISRKPDTYYQEFSYEQSVATAKGLNLDVLFPKDDELFVDLDSEEAFEYHKEQLELLEAQLPDLIHYTGSTFSKSGPPNRHVIVKLAKPISNMERILLQALLVSDRRATLISFIKESQGDPHPVLFFEPKPDALPPAPAFKQLMTGLDEVEAFLKDEDIPC